jgi:hypothetical protein
MASATHKKPGKPTSNAARAPKAGPARPARPKHAKPATPAEATNRDDAATKDRAAPALAEVDADVLEFIAALDRFKKRNSRPFPSWSEVLLVLRELGYEKR